MPPRGRAGGIIIACTIGICDMQAPRLSTADERVSKDDCSRVVVVDGGDDDKPADYYDDDSDDMADRDDGEQRTHAFSLCVKSERARLLYTSRGHDVTVYTVTSSALTNHNRPTTHRRARFLVKYKGRPPMCLLAACGDAGCSGPDLRDPGARAHQQRASHQTVHILFLANDRMMDAYSRLRLSCRASF